MNSAQARSYRARIHALEPLATSVLHCQLETEEPISYQPGQYCMVAVGDTARAFSFATPASSTITADKSAGTRHVEFLVNTAPNGPASRFFQAAQPHTSLTFTGPYGDFLLDAHDTRPLLYLAGGVGVAPIFAQMLALLAAHTPRRMTLLVGHRSADDMFWDTKLTELARDNHFHYQGIIGPLLDTLLTIAGLAEHAVYICGSAGMCTATAEALYEQGVSPAQVHYELFT